MQKPLRVLLSEFDHLRRENTWEFIVHKTLNWKILRGFTALAIFMATLLLSYTSAGAFALDDNMTGNFSPSMHGDTLIVKYSLQFQEGNLDSVTFYTIAQESESDAQASSAFDAIKLNRKPETNQNTTNEPKGLKGLKWSGQFHLSGYASGIPEEYVLRLYFTKTDSTSRKTKPSERTFVFYPDGKGARYVNMGITFATRRYFPDAVQSDTYMPAWRLEDHFGRLSQHSAVYLGYSINHSGTFSLYDYAKLEYEYVPWTRESGLPLFGIATSYSRVKGRKGDVEFIDKGIATEFSIKFEGPFEHIRYAYNTTASGYHRVDVMVALGGGSTGNGKFGTMYSFYRGKRVNMMSLSIYMGGGFFDTLNRRNNRPVLHKALAAIAFIPLLPMALLMGLAE